MEVPHTSQVYRRRAEADFERTNSKRSKPSMEDMRDSEEDRGRSMSE